MVSVMMRQNMFQKLIGEHLTKKISNNTDRPIYQIGETYGSYDLIRSYVSTGMLDAQFDFNMYDAAVSAFAKADN